MIGITAGAAGFRSGAGRSRSSFDVMISNRPFLSLRARRLDKAAKILSIHIVTSTFRAGLAVYGIYIAIGLALNRYFPFRDMDQWFRIFLWGTLLRAGALAILLAAVRREGEPLVGWAGM